MAHQNEEKKLFHIVVMDTNGHTDTWLARDLAHLVRLLQVLASDVERGVTKRFSVEKA